MYTVNKSTSCDVACLKFNLLYHITIIPTVLIAIQFRKLRKTIKILIRQLVSALHKVVRSLR